MKKYTCLFLMLCLMGVSCMGAQTLVSEVSKKTPVINDTSEVRRISVQDYVDKMKAGWIGQMAGVGWGGPTEFRWKGQIIPEDKMPQWKPELINQFGQDDIYVEMTFLRTLELYGMDVSIRQAGIDFANSGYQLWHANRYGRENLRNGIAPPDSGHPMFNAHADDIDYQIEADFAGLIAPGLPNVAIELGEIFGRLMNYGDGLYGGQFVGGMYAEAFFNDRIIDVINAGLKCIPSQSQYAECIRDVMTWSKQNPNDWEKTWALIEAKYQDNPDYRRSSCDKGDFNIDAKINGAYIVMGMLYGKGDMDKTIAISTRCGQDSDCNPANAGGILATMIGFKQLDDKFKSALNPEGKFSHTPYNFPTLITVCKKLVRDSVIRRGGKITTENGVEYFVIPVEVPKPSRFEQCWTPGPVANSRFTEEELARIPLARKFRRISVTDYRDKMKAGWIGQIAGVAWGAPTEFKWGDKIIPEDKMPTWTPDKINHAFGQDDLYVEMTFLRSMEEYGLDVSIRQAGIDFANSGYPLWCANDAGRKNLRKGIAPPDSSHPQFNSRGNDIDYQIEADFSGLIAPGMPNTVIKMGEKFGRLMNYGDGVYAGQFMGGMYAEAFFETDRIKIVRAGLACIPETCQYAEMVRDMVTWYKEDPSDWQKAWKKCQTKYREDPEYQKASNGGIDVKINGAYVLMGYLFGQGDLDKTIVISCRSGQDSDCNPSSSGGVLFTSLGFSRLPDRFSKELNEDTIFSHTAYNFPALLDVCEKLARQSIAQAGGRVETDANGQEIFVIPMDKPKPSKLELTWAPGPIANSRFTEEEMAKITAVAGKNMKDAISKFATGWEIANCGSDMDPGLYGALGGKNNVLLTHPMDKETGCVISQKVKVFSGQCLKLTVGHAPNGDWDLIVKIDGKETLKKLISKETCKNGWVDVTVDLSDSAGKEVTIELINQPNGWSWEAGYWAEIKLVSE